MRNNPPTQTVVANIRAEVARRRISQAQIAAATGINQQSVSRRLTGRVPFRIDELYALAELMEMPLPELLEGTQVPA